MVDVDLGGIESEKSKMSRWQIGNGSLSVLEQVYSLDPFPGLDARRELAKQLNVSPRQVQVWFQNKRQRERKISRAKGQLSTPGLPDTPAALNAQVERARAGPGLPNGLEAGMAAGDAPGGLSGGALSLAGAPGSAATLGLPPLHGGSSGAGGEAILLQPPAPGEPPRDSIFGLPMTRSCSNPAGFGQLGCPSGGMMDFDDKMEKEALDRLGLSPVEPDRRARKLASYDALPMARSMSLDSSLLGGPALLGAAPRNASFDALGVLRDGGMSGMSGATLGEQRGGIGAPRLPWLSGIGRGMTALNSADHVDMCRQAVAAAAAAFGKPGGLSGQTRASPFDQPRGQHVPVAPSPFDSQLVQQSLRGGPELMRSFSATLGEGSSYVPPNGSFQSVRGRSALRDGRTDSLDSEGGIPSLDELAAMEDLPDDLQQAIAAISDGNQGNHFEVKQPADASFDVSTTPACSDVCRSKSHSPDRPLALGVGMCRPQVAGINGVDAPSHAPGTLFAGATLQGEPMKRSGVSFIMDDMSLCGPGGLEAIVGGAEPSQIPGGGKGRGRVANPAECGAGIDPPPPLSSSHSSQSSVGGTRPYSGGGDGPTPPASAATSTATEPQSQMSSAEASDMQAAADSYVQVILSGEAPYQIVWASEAWLKLVGYPNDEACGKTLQLVEGPLTSQASVDLLTRAIRAGNALKVPMIYHARSGRAFSHEMRVEPLKDSLGLVQCFQVTSAQVQFLRPEAPLPGQYSFTEPSPSETEPPPPMSASGLGAGKGDGRLEIDEMLEWLDSGPTLKEHSAECLS